MAKPEIDIRMLNQLRKILASPCTIKQMAAALCVAERTIHRYLKYIEEENKLFWVCSKHPDFKPDENTKIVLYDRTLTRIKMKTSVQSWLLREQTGKLVKYRIVKEGKK